MVEEYDMSSLRLVISGAAPLGAELEKELSRRLGTNVAQVCFSLFVLVFATAGRRRLTPVSACRRTD